MDTQAFLSVVPRDLLDAPQWVAWNALKVKARNGSEKLTKVPWNARNGLKASSTDAKTWTTIQQAFKACREYGFDGVGFVVTKATGITGIDLDHCRDAETGAIEPWAQAICDEMHSYTEITPSQTGLRIYIRATLPAGRRRKDDLEMYDEGRFFTVTGDALYDYPLAIEERQEQLDALHKATFAVTQAPTRKATPSEPVRLDDQALLKKAQEAKNGQKFFHLWRGDASDYGDDLSRADLALCGMLAFWTGGDASRTDRLFRQSGLMRDKWDSQRGESTYGQRTILTALSTLGDTYSPIPLQMPRGNSQKRSQEPPPPTDGANALQPPPMLARKRYPQTEFGNAERLLDTYGAGIRYNKAFGFIVWGGKRWKTDDELSVRGYAKATVRDIYKEASQLAMRASSATDDEERKSLAQESESLMKWARSSESNHMVMAMTALIKNACQLETDCFDNQSWLFNCENGTLDLRTGGMRTHRQEDFLTQLAPVAFDPDAECPIFEAFINQIMCERDDLVDYLRRAFGYCLTGLVSEQVWHLLVGTDGENGKSTLIEALLHVLGDYGDTVEPETISIGSMQRDANAPSPDIARLKGRRFVAISETEEGARLAPAKLKKLSGDRYLTARFMRKDIFTFMPSFKMFVHTNHKPQARETTHAFWRRVRYIPFDFTLKDQPEKKDKKLPEKLQAEASGILAWLVRGCLEWQHEGLNPPPVVLDATGAYRDESDVFKLFLEEKCEIGPQERVAVKTLYLAYQNWCEEAGEKALPQRRFVQVLKERGYEYARGFGPTGGWGFKGIGIGAD